MIDDEEGFRAFFRYVLEPLGYEVRLAADGDAALAELDAGSFDLVLLDWNLGRLPGRDVLRRIQERRPLVLVAVLSVTCGVFEEEARALGAWDCRPKPTDPAALRELVARAVREGRGRLSEN